jgi:hypothetical protein
MAGYSTYTSPIDRMGAIAQVGGEVQRQQIVNQEQPLRQGLLRQEGQINDQVIQQNTNAAADRVTDRQLAKQKYENMEELKTNAARASTLLSIKDPQQKREYLLSIADEYAGEGNMKAAQLFSQASLNDPNMTDASAMQFVQEAVANGIKFPQQAQPKKTNLQKAEGVDAQGNPIMGAFDPASGQYVNPQTSQPFAAGEFKPKPARSGPLVNNMGPIPQGMKVVTDEQGNQHLEEIPNGPVERERLKVEAKARRKAVSNIFEKRRDLGQINKIRSQANKMTTGVAAQALGWIPWTDAGALEANKKSLLAKIGFDALQDMRDDSPTGGALGNVSERELDFLQRALASLDAAQSTEQFLENLDEVAARYERSLAVLEAEYDPNSEWAGMDMQQIDALINEKYPIFVAGQSDKPEPSVSPGRAAELEAKYGL